MSDDLTNSQIALLCDIGEFYLPKLTSDQKCNLERLISGGYVGPTESHRTANHPVAMVVNRDASHFCAGPGNGESALHGQAVPGGWSGSAGPRHARYAGGHARRSRRRNRSGRGRNNYRSAPERGIPHT